MAKMYTLDGKLLTELPEIRVDGAVFAVDNRKKTVEEMLRMQESGMKMENTDDLLKLALGEKAFEQLGTDEMPFPAYQKLFELVCTAMTGEDPDAVAIRFPGEEEKA